MKFAGLFAVFGKAAKSFAGKESSVLRLKSSMNSVTAPSLGRKRNLSFIGVSLNSILLVGISLNSSVIAKSAGWLHLLPKIGAACLVMAICIVQIQQPLGWWIEASILIRAAWLALCIGVGGASYFAVLLALGIRPSQFVLKQ